MQVVVDADVLAAPRSGVGVYLTEILTRIEREFTVERRMTSKPGGSASTKRSLVRHVPFAYDLRRAMLGWPPTRQLFFAPNFLLPPSVLTRGPKVVTVHDLIFLQHPEWADRTRGAYLRRTLESTVKQADAIIAVSEQTKRELEQAYGVGHKTHVALNGIRQLNIKRAKQPRGVLCIGNIEPRKDPLTLLLAHRTLPATLRREHPLTFVGAAMDQRYAQRLKESLDPPYSRWCGNVDDAALSALLEHAALVVTPSLAEGFGIVPLEAAAAGVPVLSADIIITKELLGSRGEYFAARNSESLTVQMQRLLLDPPAVDARDLYDRFSWETSAKTHASVFRSLGG